MLFALNISGDKILPSYTGERAICPLCKSTVLARCGDIVVHHWAHKSDSDCDSWSEGETEWHKGWKSHFPKEWQEVVMKKSGEVHRADIRTRTGLVVELQNSPIQKQTILEREHFYGRMIWLVNAIPFKANFELTNALDQEAASLKREIEFQQRCLDGNEVNGLTIELINTNIEIGLRRKNVLRIETNIKQLWSLTTSDKQLLDFIAQDLDGEDNRHDLLYRHRVEMKKIIRHELKPTQEEHKKLLEWRSFFQHKNKSEIKENQEEITMIERLIDITKNKVVLKLKIWAAGEIQKFHDELKIEKEELESQILRRNQQIESLSLAQDQQKLQQIKSSHAVSEEYQKKFQNLKKELEGLYIYKWNWRRKSWDSAIKSIYLDFGDHLMKIKSDKYLKLVNKDEFIQELRKR